MKMNLNKIGLTARKNASVILNTILGIRTKLERKQPRNQETTETMKNFFIEKELRKTLIDAEIQRNYAYMYSQNFQKY